MSQLLSVFGNITGVNTGGTVTGGFSPQEAALAAYTDQQGQIKNANTFSSGMGMSTGLTYADAGTHMGTALNLAGVSDANAQAQNQLASLAQQVQQSSGLGSSTGIFGNQGGNTSTTTSTDSTVT
jgi:hypothetical protein